MTHDYWFWADALPTPVGHWHLQLPFVQVSYVGCGRWVWLRLSSVFSRLC